MNHFSEIRNRLSAYGLDAMLLTCAPNRFYATDFPSIGTDGLALVTRSDTYYFTDFRYIEAANASVRGAHVEMTTPGRGYIALVNEVIDRERLVRLGYEEDYMTVSAYRRYSEKLHCELVPGGALLTELRTVKDEEALRSIVGAQRITEKALDAVLSELRPGVTERELAARITYFLLHFGAENKSFDPIVLCGPNGSLPHGLPGDRQIAAGDFVTMDFGCVYNGYCSDMTRTVAVGHATEEMRRVYDIVLRAQKAGIAAARAGVSGAQIDAAARDLIAAEGYGEAFGHSFGHGVGIEIHETPNASPGWSEPLPAGAVISAEPGIYLPGRFGVRIEDMLIL